ncbi:hypothetical protein [Aggregatibacter actinomycetemcomitans]|uniref:hypothetical protein n=1 Tax=Aggregatibacter actinomycetemcomitans TaxID=714 RepID=UPI00197C1CEC|nr:hypothetical protein [Aggregatibacter actinomycetemcomitans]MBN6080052.1 hypothetical protein [Aggregatibacter actinomycetemcomitans]
MTDLTLAQQQETQALVAKQMTQDMAEAYEIMGTLKAFNFVQKLLTVGSLKKLQEIKETKKYKGLSFVDDTGNLLTVGNFADFCKACGLSDKKVYEDLQNLNSFGEEFMETSQRLGLGYREMRKLRKLPEDARAEIMDAEFTESADKEELLGKIEELTAKHAHEKQVLEGQLKQSQANYEAQSQILKNKNDRINQLDIELEKKKNHINTLTPDEKGGLLRKSTSQLAYNAEAILRGQVWKAFETLDAHTQESGIDHKQFMVGTLAEIELVLNELRTAFNLPRLADGDNTPEWDRADFQAPDYGAQFNAILNGDNQ